MMLPLPSSRNHWKDVDRFYYLKTEKADLIGVRRIFTKMEFYSIDVITKKLYSYYKSGDKAFKAFREVTGPPTPSGWPKGRIFISAYPNRIYYLEYTNWENYFGWKWKGDSYNNITSNIAVKYSQSIVVYGVATARFEKGGIRFRDFDLEDKFVVELDQPFIYCQFHPSTDVVMTHKIEGELCLISYDLGAEAVSVTSCHFTTSPEFSIEFVNDSKFIMTRESIIMVYDYPSITLSHVYSPQPIFFNQLPGGKTKQVHVFPGIKLRMFDTHAMEYSTGNLYEGKVLKAYFNPHDEDEVFTQVGLEKIVRIKVSSKAILGEFQPLTQVAGVSSTYRDCKLLAFDLYKVKTSLLMALYCCYRKTDDEVFYYFIEFNYDTDTLSEFELQTFDDQDDRINQLRIGVDNGKDIVGVKGAKYSYIFEIQYTPFKLNSVSSNSGTGESLFYFNLELVKSNQIFIAINQNIVAKFSQITTSPHFYTTTAKTYPMTNCLPDTIPEDTSTTPTTPERLVCGGTGLHLGEAVLNAGAYYNGIYAILRMSGATFLGPDGTFYSQSSEKIRVRYNIEGGKCEKNNYQDVYHSYTSAFSNSVTDCDYWSPAKDPYYCTRCKNGKFAHEGNCIDSPCPAGTFEFSGICRKHCPIGLFKLDESWDKPQCVKNCSDHFPSFYEMADRCLSKCPTGSNLVAHECQCPEGLFASEDGTACVSDSCLPSGYKMHHYRMCVNEIRNSSKYQVYNGNNIYCDDRHFLNLTTMRCVDSCPNGISFHHKDYGYVCLIETFDCENILNQYWDLETENCVPMCLAPNNVIISFNKTCVSSCPPEFYFSPQTKTCETEKSCHEMGNVYTLSDGYPKTCTNSCPEGLYYHSWTKSCVSVSDCKKNKRFTRNDTMECLMDAECMEASQFPILETRDCIKNCPIGTGFIRGFFKCSNFTYNQTSNPEDKELEIKGQKLKGSKGSYHNFRDRIMIFLFGREKYEEISKTYKRSKFTEWFINLTVVYIFVIYGLPLIESLLTGTNYLSFYCFLAQTNGKVMMTTLFAMRLSDEVNEIYSYVFQDILGIYSEFITETIKKGTVEIDQKNVCQNSSWRFCDLETPSNFLSNQSLLIVVLLVGFILWVIFFLLKNKGKYFKTREKKLKYDILANFWLENQSDIVPSLIFCITHPYFGTWLLIFGYLLSIAGMATCYTMAYLILFKGMWNNKTKFRRALVKHMSEDFKTNKDGAFYIGLNFLFDSFMALIIFLLRNFPVVNSFLWLVLQIIYCYNVFKKVEFRKSVMRKRAKVIEVGFCVLSLGIFFLTLSEKNDILSWCVYIVSVGIIVVDFFVAISYFFYTTFTKCPKKKKIIDEKIEEKKVEGKNIQDKKISNGSDPIIIMNKVVESPINSKRKSEKLSNMIKSPKEGDNMIIEDKMVRFPKKNSKKKEKKSKKKEEKLDKFAKKERKNKGKKLKINSDEKKRKKRKEPTRPFRKINEIEIKDKKKKKRSEEEKKKKRKRNRGKINL